MKTNVLETEQPTHNFLRSLPLTAKEFIHAKFLVNLPLFGLFRTLISAAGFYFGFGGGLFPLGAVPFVTMVLLGGFVAYCSILAVSLLTQSLGITVLCIKRFGIGTPACLWVEVFFAPVAQQIWGQQPVSNTAAIAIVAAKMASCSVVMATLHIQNQKPDFM